MPEPIWVRYDVVLAIHQRQLAEHGGGKGIRDSGLLKSALNKPENLYHYSNPAPTLAAMAASYAYGISLNHPFVDGNKRMALIICQLFLRLNGVQITAGKAEKYDTLIRLASGGMSEQSLAKWITEHIRA